MRAFVLVPVVVALAGAIAFATIRATGHDPHIREMIAAAVACLLAGELAATPMLSARQASQAAVAQAALIGTVVHLFVCVVIAGVVILGHLPLGQSFVYWLLGLYWATLIALVVAFAKAVQSAPTAG